MYVIVENSGRILPEIIETKEEATDLIREECIIDEDAVFTLYELRLAGRFIPEFELALIEES